ncbi:DnaA N-terminal domain-containing protein [Acidimangrovimonas sediminis]|uniref:DnaA N-terminal domain-containing protein n=1 Tax=Acidimangrovimonas sediminis TaxID=2056283 RepID=UPI000C7FA5FC|nr:DnaA N-terminal domain-containing protein [Acidimangrovimonas sediminis]
MHLVKPVGREASARKYDLLSALMAHALSHDKHVQRQVLRLMALITTRYNWKRDELSMGQDEIARLWSVDTRTVKREMARLKAQGWLVIKRQGARGRVSVYGIDLSKVMEDTRPSWPNIGQDFIDRVAAQDSAGAGEAAGQGGNVVPLRTVAAPARDGTLWREAQAALHAADPAAFGAWFGPLEEVSAEEGCLTLLAPSLFHANYVRTHLSGRLEAAVRRLDPSIRSVRVEA